MPLTSIDDAVRRIRRGEMVLVVDDEDRENEGDLTLAAEWITPEAVNFMLRWARGLVCMPCAGFRLDKLEIGPMIPPGQAGCDTAFTVSIDHCTAGSGIGAADRALTVKRLLEDDACPSDFVRPGHVFPLRARDGGVLERRGHTEAAVDLAALAGLAGGLYTFLNLFVNFETFTFFHSISFLLMVILGGMGTLFGPLYGTIAFFVLEETLPPLLDLLRKGWGEYWQIVFGPMLVLIALYAKGGIDSLLGRRHG